MIRTWQSLLLTNGRLKCSPLGCPCTTERSWQSTLPSGAPSQQTGLACPNTAHTNGAVLHRARIEKESKYRELFERCRLVVTGMGDWRSMEHRGRRVLSVLSQRNDHAKPLLFSSCRRLFAWRRRWMRMLSVSCARSVASSLVLTPSHSLESQDGSEPDVADLFQFTWRAQECCLC